MLRDFVELPSQFFEHFLQEPVVLQRHARHFETGEVIPDALLKKLQRSQAFGKGFDTVEYAACALVDQMLHTLPAADVATLDIDAFEAATLARLGMPAGIIMRHRPSHFSHLFASSSYAAAYYCYLWAEVLDADAFEGLKGDDGDVFNSERAARLRKFIYSSGNSLEPGAAFRAFRGRDPVIGPMLKKKHLVVE